MIRGPEILIYFKQNFKYFWKIAYFLYNLRRITLLMSANKFKSLNSKRGQRIGTRNPKDRRNLNLWYSCILFANTSSSPMSNSPLIPTFLTYKEILFFFKRHPGMAHKWVCSCSQKRTQRGTGYTNLLHHVRRAYPDYADTILAAKQSSLNSYVFKNTIVKNQVRKLHAWLETVVVWLKLSALLKTERFANTSK